MAARMACAAASLKAMARLGIADGSASLPSTASREAPSTRNRSSLPGGGERRPDEAKTKDGKKVMIATIASTVEVS